MKLALLDTNFLIALGDPNHIHADAALHFFSSQALRSGWATCPLTENAFIRILGHPNYPGGPRSTTAARQALLSITAQPGHHFWEDQLSLTDTTIFPRLTSPSALTDIYLLALAVKHDAWLVTFDTSIDPSLVSGGTSSLHVLQK